NWLTAERAHWTRRSVEVLVACAVKRLAAGALAEATRAAQAALERGSTPSNAALRALMRCLALAEDLAGALKLYEDCAARLRAELGAEPDTETKALAERIRQGRTWRLPERVRDGEGAADSRRPPLVWRAAGGGVPRRGALAGCRVAARPRRRGARPLPRSGALRLHHRCAAAARRGG